MRQYAARLEEDIKKLEIQISDAAETGGNQWHDNFSYEQITQQIRGLDHRLQEVHNTLRQAVLAPRPSGSEVAIGTKVKIKFNDDQEDWYIGGHGESDPDVNILAYDTPLAQLMLGKKVGEVAEGKIAEQKVRIEILGIETDLS